MGTRALKDVQVGDRVWVEDDRRRIICTVTRLTAKQIVTDWPWGKNGARFWRGQKTRYGDELHYRKIGYSGWYSSEIQGIATKAECEKYDAEQEAQRQKAAAEADARDRRENHRNELNNLFGDRMVSVYEGHHDKAAEWLVRVSLTTQGVIKLAALLEALTPEELPSWQRN